MANIKPYQIWHHMHRRVIAKWVLKEKQIHHVTNNNFGSLHIKRYLLQQAGLPLTASLTDNIMRQKCACPNPQQCYMPNSTLVHPTRSKRKTVICIYFSKNICIPGAKIKRKFDTLQLYQGEILHYTTVLLFQVKYYPCKRLQQGRGSTLHSCLWSLSRDVPLLFLDSPDRHTT